ncbi:MAG TPA: B12-binding domain-containing radical SAM protein [Spirochaetales bacterium]|nr:B12-binding domain-containing radical SAM protein [Spirochaetales bacterium]HRZ63428.1 B12-binding domain-containing radical SAM protein [Spirochaetia bacterium]
MERKKILLVYPKIPATYWSMKHAISLIGKKGLMPPLGLLTIAGYLPEGEYETVLVDMNVRRLRNRDLAGAGLAMVSAMLVQKDSFFEVLRRCRAAGVPIAVGGPYPTACPEEMGEADYLVLDEGEVTLPRFLADWKAGRAERVYSDEAKPALDSGPLPRFDLVDPSRYANLPVQFSRGCPFNCEFCDIVTLFGRVPRTKSPERFLRELQAILETGFRGNVFVVDDNFIGNKARVKELLRALGPWQAERGYPFRLSTEASVDLGRDEELLDLMVAANFTMVFLGLETPDAGSLECANKGQNLRLDPAKAVEAIQRKGIEVTGGFIVGFDADPPGICEAQIRFVTELAVPVAMVGLLTALPRTALRDRLEREGRLLSRSSGDNTHSASFNFRTVLPEKGLLEGYFRVLGEIYRPRAYFDRCLELLRRFPDWRRRPRPGAGRTVTPRNLLYLVRSLVIQGCSRYGAEYFRYVWKALRISPGLVESFITYAVQGRHFFIITRRFLRGRAAALAAAASLGELGRGAAGEA